MVSFQKFWNGILNCHWSITSSDEKVGNFQLSQAQKFMLLSESINENSEFAYIRVLACGNFYGNLAFI